jgi:hypothetical protein
MKTSAQDQFAKWAKLRRSVDKGLGDLEKLSAYMFFSDLGTCLTLQFLNRLRNCVSQVWLRDEVQLIVVASNHGSAIRRWLVVQETSCFLPSRRMVWTFRLVAFFAIRSRGYEFYSGSILTGSDDLNVQVLSALVYGRWRADV